MADNKEQNLTEDIEERNRKAKEKFDKNLNEFKNKKIKEIPCFRSTFLTSIPSGLVIGLASYLFTSRAKLSANLAMGSYLLISGVYFANCRMEYSKKVEQNAELGELMNLIIKYRGTELEEQFQKRYQEKVREMDTKSKYV